MSTFLWYVLTVLIVFGAGLLAIRMAIPPYVQHLLDVRVTELPDVEWRSEKLPELTAQQEDKLDRLIKVKAAELRELELEELPPPLELVWSTMQDVGHLFFPEAEDPRWSLSPEQFLDAMLRTSDLLRKEAHSLSFKLPLLGEYNLGAWILDQPIERYIQTADWAKFLGELRDQFGTTGKVAGEASKFAFPLLTGGLGSIFTHTIKEAGLLLLKRKVAEQYARLYTHFAREVIAAYSQRSYLQDDEKAALWEAQWLGVLVSHCGVSRTEAAMTAVHYLIHSPRNFRSREKAVARFRKAIEKGAPPEDIVPARVRNKPLMKCIDSMPGLTREALVHLQRLTSLLGEPSKQRKALETRIREQVTFASAGREGLGAALLADVLEFAPAAEELSWENWEESVSSVSSATAVLDTLPAWEKRVWSVRKSLSLDVLSSKNLAALEAHEPAELLGAALGLWLWSGAHQRGWLALRERQEALFAKLSLEDLLLQQAERSLIGGLYSVDGKPIQEEDWSVLPALWKAVAEQRKTCKLSAGSLLPLVALVQRSSQPSTPLLTRALVADVTKEEVNVWWLVFESRSEAGHWILEPGAEWHLLAEIELLPQAGRWVWRGKNRDSSSKSRFLNDESLALDGAVLDVWRKWESSSSDICPRAVEVWTALVGAALLKTPPPSVDLLARERQRLVAVLERTTRSSPALSVPTTGSESDIETLPFDSREAGEKVGDSGDGSEESALSGDVLEQTEPLSLRMVVLAREESLSSKVCSLLQQEDGVFSLPLDNGTELQLQPVAGPVLESWEKVEDLPAEIREADAWLLVLAASPPTWKLESETLSLLRELDESGASVMVALAEWELVPPVRGWKVDEMWSWMPGQAERLQEEAPGGRSGAKLKALWSTYHEARARLLIPAGQEDWPLLLTREGTCEHAGDSGRQQMQPLAQRLLRGVAHRQARSE